MASGVKVRMSSRGAEAILKSAEVAKKLESMGKAITDSANAQAPEHGYAEQQPFAMEVHTTNRVRVTVYTRTNLGKAMQARHNTLTNALDAGRG